MTITCMDETLYPHDIEELRRGGIESEETVYELRKYDAGEDCDPLRYSIEGYTRLEKTVEKHMQKGWQCPKFRYECVTFTELKTLSGRTYIIRPLFPK